MRSRFDALILVSFGGPEGMDDVIPFLENVLRGKNVPPERMAAVARHYERFGGISPINQQNRDLIAALQARFAKDGPDLPIYWGNRNWHPMLADTISRMADDGIERALAFVTSAYGSYSGCRQYLENIDAASEVVTAQGKRPPAIKKLRVYFNHPCFIEANADNLRLALENISPDRRRRVRVLFSAHSIPTAMADGCLYEKQLRETAALVAKAAGAENFEVDRYELVYQSRSGPPGQPWLEPDVLDRMRELASSGDDAFVIQPIGFISDHMEVKFDLDIQARELADELGVELARAATVGTHPAFIEMIRQLVLEELEGAEMQSLGEMGLLPEQCRTGCCPSGR
ncbi:MAG: ferrochelatase [Candidatus Melainabacteria bacterium]|nr:ferrochelatase [Candidatus Melainabacteria bacterium]